MQHSLRFVFASLDEQGKGSILIIRYVKDPMPVIFQTARHILQRIAAVEADRQNLPRFHIFQFYFDFDIRYRADNIGNIDRIIYFHNFLVIPP